MRMKAGWLSGIVVIAALGLAIANTALAQTTSTSNVKNFEVISVDGNMLVFRDQNGTNAITVPNDFRFTVDGKKMAVSELKPGMKGTAVITTTTTVTPVYVAEFREAVVLSAGPTSMIVRDKEGVRKRYSQDQLDQRGIQIVKDGRVLRVGEVKEGDVLTATIVSQIAPVVVTEQEVQAALTKSAAQPAPAKTESPAPAPAAQPTPAPTAAPTTPTPSPTPAPAPAPSTPMPASPPAESSGISGMTWLLIAIVVVALLFFFMRRKKPA
jgi:hypothetical protein